MWRIIHGNALTVLRDMPSESVQCVITSPPYWGLRAYNTEPQIWGGEPNCEHVWEDATYVRRSNDAKPGDKQGTNYGSLGRDVPVRNQFCSKCGAWRGELGLEPTPQLFLEHLVEIFREVKRVLRKDGLAFVNMGDSFASKQQRGQAWGDHSKRTLEVTGAHGEHAPVKDWSCWNLGPKQLVGMPWRLAFALQDDGWILRSDIVWAKSNPMPESVTDRPTKAHEYVFMFAKNERYFYDAEAIKEDCVNGDPASPRGSNGVLRMKNAGRRKQDELGKNTYTGFNDRHQPLLKRNKRSVWSIPTQPFPEAHFAVYPEALVEPMILAGSSPKACPKCGAPWVRIVEKQKAEVVNPRPFGKAGNADRNDTLRIYEESVRVAMGWRPSCSCSSNDGSGKCIILDPFSGSGTTGVVALRHGRDYIGIELNPKYVEMSKRRIIGDAPLLNFLPAEVAQ
jgi:DNA modification methylase